METLKRSASYRELKSSISDLKTIVDNEELHEEMAMLKKTLDIDRLTRAEEFTAMHAKFASMKGHFEKELQTLKDFVLGVDNPFTRNFLRKLQQLRDEFAMEQDARAILDKNVDSFILDTRRTAEKAGIACLPGSMQRRPDTMGRKKENLFEPPTLLLPPKEPEMTSSEKIFRLTVSSCEQVHKLGERPDASHSSVVGMGPGLCSGERMLAESLAMILPAELDCTEETDTLQ